MRSCISCGGTAHIAAASILDTSLPQDFNITQPRGRMFSAAACSPLCHQSGEGQSAHNITSQCHCTHTLQHSFQTAGFCYILPTSLFKLCFVEESFWFSYFTTLVKPRIVFLLLCSHQVAYDSRSHLRAPGLPSALPGSSGGKPWVFNSIKHTLTHTQIKLCSRIYAARGSYYSLNTKSAICLALFIFNSEMRTVYLHLIDASLFSQPLVWIYWVFILVVYSTVKHLL